MGYHGSKTATDIFVVVGTQGAWTSRGDVAVGAVMAKTATHESVPDDGHRIVHGTFTIVDQTSLTIGTDAKLVVLDDG